mmetsp:Transcript_146735/g.256256  ORF Transcript_146735/g.256256 Transcript_146735/m.256256 type:complete len:87 (+) Transcript_146735:131-391(+)
MPFPWNASGLPSYMCTLLVWYILCRIEAFSKSLGDYVKGSNVVQIAASSAPFDTFLTKLGLPPLPTPAKQLFTQRWLLRGVWIKGG